MTPPRSRATRSSHAARAGPDLLHALRQAGALTNDSAAAGSHKRACARASRARRQDCGSDTARVRSTFPTYIRALRRHADDGGRGTFAADRELACLLDMPIGMDYEGTLLGECLGNYRLVRMIGRGSMGEVYEAEHVLIGRHVAVKVLLPQLSRSAEAVNRFFTEARTAATMRHPGIV